MRHLICFPWMADFAQEFPIPSIKSAVLSPKGPFILGDPPGCTTFLSSQELIQFLGWLLCLMHVFFDEVSIPCCASCHCYLQVEGLATLHTVFKSCIITCFGLLKFALFPSFAHTAGLAMDCRVGSRHNFCCWCPILIPKPDSEIS